MSGRGTACPAGAPARMGVGAVAIVALCAGAPACRSRAESTSSDAAAPLASMGAQPGAAASGAASASVAAQPSGSAPAAPPPVMGEPRTALQVLALTAVTREDFEKRIEDDAWAFYDPGTTDCPVGGEAVHLDRPTDAVREFDRPKVRAALVDTLIYTSSDRGIVKADDDSGVLSPYNHAAGTFTLKLHPSAQGWGLSAWSVLGGIPQISIDRQDSTVGDVFVADRGGGYVLTTPRFVPSYDNTSVATFTVKIDVDTAKKWTAEGAALRYLVVERFKKLGFHKNCMRVCKRTGQDSVDCPEDPENQGFGRYFVTEPVGYEVYLDDKIIAEKQPPLPPPAASTPGSQQAPASSPASTPAPPSSPPSSPRGPSRTDCIKKCVASCADDASCERTCVAKCPAN